MTKYFQRVIVVAFMAIPCATFGAATHGMTTNAKTDFLRGAFQVPASACTSSGVPSPCCTGTGAGATCPTYKLALLTSSSTAGSGSTTWASISANEASGTGYTAGGATLTGFAVSGTCWTFTSPVTWTTATITAQSAVVYCSANCPALDVVSIHCLDGTTGTCSANTSSTGGTFTVNLPGGGIDCIN